MKRIMIISAVVIFMVFNSNIYAQGIGFGLRAGANFANQSWTDLSTESRTGFHGGAYFILAFSETWAIQPEFLFSSQGSEVPVIDDVKELDYFSIPVLLRFKPVSFLSIEAGPQFSSLLSAVNKSGDSIKDDFKKSDFGLALGATAHLPLGINGGLRYVWGFSNVNDLQNDIEVKNRMFQIYVGWTFLGAN